MISEIPSINDLFKFPSFPACTKLSPTPTFELCSSFRFVESIPCVVFELHGLHEEKCLTLHLAAAGANARQVIF